MTDARVVITGAASTIGRGVVHAFAAEGARIVVNDTDAPRAETVRDEALALGAAQVHLVVADLAVPGAAEAVVGTAQVAWGGIDVLISNASTVPEHVEKVIDPDKWQRLVEINLLSAISLTQAAIQSMRDGNGGSIVFIARDAGSGRPPQNVHRDSHAPLFALLFTIARAYGGDGIRSGIVCPGSAIPDGSESTGRSDLWSFRHFGGWGSHPIDVFGEDMPMRRLTADDIGRAVVDFSLPRTAQQAHGPAKFSSRHLHKVDHEPGGRFTDGAS